MSNSRFGLRTRTGVIATILESFNNVEGLVFKVDSSDTNSYTGTGIIWNDLSGYGNTGTLYNSPTFEQSNLKSFRFDGVNAYANFGNSTKLNTGNQITVFSIFQINSTKTYQPIIAKSPLLETGGWELANSGGVLRVTLYPDNSNINNLYAGELQIDRWYIAAFTYNGSIFKIYLDGQIISQMTITTAFPTIDSTANLLLGRRDMPNYYKGNILYAATYAKAYSDSQVLDEYNNLKSKVSVVSQGLILNLDANNIASYSGSGNTWVDLSGSGNHATLTNNPTFDSTYKSFKFNGINQSFTITPGTNLYPRTNDFTWSAWLNFGEINYGSKYRTIWYGNASGGNSGFGITLEPQNNRFIVEVYGTTGSRQRALYNISTDIFDKWNHWTVILDKSNFQVLIYLNTNLVLTYQAVNWGDLQPYNNYVMFGKHVGDVWFYDGQVSEILIYNRKLEQYEIGKNYNLTKYRYDKIDDGLIMHLDAATTTSYNGGGTIWYDISGNNNHSTLLGHTYDKVDRGSIILDGITSQITTPIIAESPSTVSYTYEITFSLDSMDIGYYSLMGRVEYLTSGFGLVLYINITTATLYYHAYGASSSATSTSFNIDKVTHTVYTVTMTISGRTANFYLNGVYKTQVTGTHDIVKYSQPILIGNGVQGGWLFSNIRVYNVKIYDKVLKLSEIIRNWKSIKSRYGVQIVKTGLKLYLDGENTLSNTRAGSVWYDLSGYDNNASLINSPIQSNQNSGIVKFDGTNQYASVPHSDTLNLGTGDFTLLMWVGDMRSYPGQKTLLWKGSVYSESLSQALIEGKGVGFSITWASSPQQLYFLITTTSSISQIALTEYNASWSGYKLIGIKRSGNQIFSINDTVVTLKGTIGTMNINNTNPLYIANSGYYSNNFLKSEIGMVTIYEKALTNDEILQNYNVTKNKYKDKTFATSGLQLNLDAGKTASYYNGSSWIDLSNPTNSATMSGGFTFSSANQGSLVFDGINGKADFYSPNLDTTVTVEMWVKIPSSNNSGRIIYGFNRYNIYILNDSIGFNTGNSDLYGISGLNTLGLYDSWHHFLFVMRSDVHYSANKIYIDGAMRTLSQIQGSENSTNRNTFNGGNGSISTWRATVGYFMPQSVGIFRIYNRELTRAEVLQNFNATKQRYI